MYTVHKYVQTTRNYVLRQENGIQLVYWRDGEIYALVFGHTVLKALLQDSSFFTNFFPEALHFCWFSNV